MKGARAYRMLKFDAIRQKKKASYMLGQTGMVEITELFQQMFQCVVGIKC